MSARPNATAETENSSRPASGEQTTVAGCTYCPPQFVWLILLLTAITCSGTLRFGFVYDDQSLIVQNPFLRAWHYVPQYFASSLWKHTSPLAPANYYRPLFLLLLRMNYAIFTDRPFGWHLAAVLLHLTVTWLVYVLLRQLTGQFTLAWLGALIFGMHPIHHEAVAWISDTIESLVAVLLLSAFLCYLRSRERSRGAWVWMGTSCALYGSALLSKETAIILPLLVFAHGWIEYPTGGKAPELQFVRRFLKAITPAASYLPIALVYLLVRNRVLLGVGHPADYVSLGAWLMTVPSILLFYVKHWFLPFGFSEYYDVFYQTRFSLVHVLLPLTILIALGAGVWIWRERLGTKAAAHAIAWLIIPLLPALDTFVFKPEELVHDRYFHVASIGAALLVSLIVARAVRTRPALFGQPWHVVATAGALTVVLAFLTARATSPWASNYTLFSRAHQIAPSNAVATNNLGSELIIRGELDAAQALLEDGYRRHPDFRMEFNLGRVQYAKQHYPQAEAYTRQALSVAPLFPEAYVSLAQIELKQNRPAEALESMRHAVELNPYSAPFHTSYGIVLALNGDCKAASQQFETALALNPGEGLTEMQLARCRAALSSTAPPSSKPGEL